MSTATEPTRRMSLAEVVRLGQAGRPWEFLPIGVRAALAVPDQPGLAVLVADNFARLGLRTLAREWADAGSADPRSSAVRATADRLGDDALSVSSRIALAARNVEAWSRRGIDLAAEFDAWRAASGGWEWFRALDGNIVRRPRGSTDPRSWLGLGDQRGASRRFAETHLTDTALAHRPPITLEGIDPPWILREAASRSGPKADGLRSRLLIVQNDPHELLDGAAQADLVELIDDPRTEWFIGAGATRRLRDDLAGRFSWSLRGPYVPLASLRTRCDPPVDHVLAGVMQQQQAEQERLTARVRSAYAGRGVEFWRDRYARAATGGPPLRVLIPTTRFSTYIQHASGDLAQAIRAIGLEARVMIEPDECSRATSLAMLREFDEFAPDLVILINYPRSAMGEHVPKEVPWVAWIQDAMPQQFDAAVGRAQGELDFVVGHLHAELFEKFAYPPSRRASMPVVASAQKFHPGPIDAGLRARVECEVSAVTHHAETPEAMRARLLAEGGASGPVRRGLERLAERARDAARDAMTRSALADLGRATTTIFREELGRDPEPTLVARALRNFALPLADRWFRHEALAWAAEICQRRGWRLRLFGRGWESHPSLACFAAGELEHGEALRAAYQCSAVSLHASLHAMVHQRVVEAALSGGLPIARLHADGLNPLKGHAQAAAARLGPPVACRVADRFIGYRVVDCPELMALTALKGRLGLKSEPFVWTRPERVESLARAGGVPIETRADWLLVDLADTSFSSSAGLEAIVERAAEHPGWRSAMGGAIARRARERFTSDVLAGRILGLVRDALEGRAGT